jgi:hypothetical protein
MTTKAKKATTKKAAAKKGAAKKGAAKAAKASDGTAALKSAVKGFRVLVEREEGHEVCAIHVPFDVEKTFGTRGRVPVRGTLNGAAFRGSLFPMRGRHIFVVNRKLREASGVRGGETVSVRLGRDTEPRVVNPPADFSRALKANREARDAWDKLSYTHRREHVEHIEEAKRPETRARRVERSVALLAAGKKEPR